VIPLFRTSLEVRGVPLDIYPSSVELGAAAAHRAAMLMRDAIAHHGSARIIVGTGNSQKEVIRSLTRSPDLDWSSVEVFHMDEYVGMADMHPASFRRWLKDHMVDTVHPGRVHYLQGDSQDLAEETRRYAELLAKGPIDLCLIGFGENGHIAFNDPGFADFEDPQVVKVVTLDPRCRRQQVGEGHFPDIDSVPDEAITLTCPTLMKAEHVISCVPNERKARAVRDALMGPLTTACPASLVLRHPSAHIYVDTASASMLRIEEGRLV
jgi:glucosamine-6-phosphate deaminase